MNLYALFFAILLSCLIAAVVCFELLLCRLFTNHPMEWSRLGSPSNICDQSGFRFISGSVARWSMSRTMLVARPAWIKSDRVASVLYLMFRWSAIVNLTGFFGFVVVALLLS